MGKKLVVLGLTAGIIAMGALLFAAFESYVLNINAHVEPALNVFPHGQWNLGNVFPEEDFTVDVKVGVSKSFQAEDNVTSVSYVVNCQAKAGGALNICNAIKVSQDSSLLALPWTDSVNRTNDKEDVYNLNFIVPDCIGASQKEAEVAKEIDCGKQGIDVSAAFSIRVLDINRNDDKEPEPKQEKQYVLKATASSTDPFSGDPAPFDRLDIQIPKTGDFFWVNPNGIHATIKNGVCDPVTVKGKFSNHEKDANAGADLFDDEMWGFVWPSDCISAGDTVIIQFELTQAALDHLANNKDIGGPQDVTLIKSFSFCESSTAGGGGGNLGQPNCFGLDDDSP